MLRRLLLAVPSLVVALAGAMPAPAAAQQYPTKPVRMVVPLAAGSITDIITRLVAQHLSQTLGQSIVVDNKPGADGAIAALEVKRATPDGYTLLMGTNSPLAVAPNLQKQPSYDPIKDFTPITYVGSATFFLVVHPSVPAKTLPELLAHAKANPKKVAYATGNTMSIVGTAVIASRAGLELLHIPYKGEPQAIAELVTGQTQMAVAAYSTVAPHVNDGKLRALVTLLPERSKLLPDVPSIVEAGMERMPISPWAALVGPAGLPQDIAERLSRDVRAILARPEIGEQLLRQGVSSKGSTPGELATFMKDEFEAWGRIMKAAGLEPQ